MSAVSTKLVELTELEKSFFKTSRIEAIHPSDTLSSVEVPRKKIKIRECSDLRSWWDDDCSDKKCASLESAS